jgi:sugar lactone lactonase YvrE
MPGRELQTLWEGGTFLEGPRWHDGRWWVSDFFTNRVVAITPDGSSEDALVLDGAWPSGLGWLPDGSLLAVSMLERTVVRLSPAGELSVHADLGEIFPGPANDMVVDAAGRAWVGNFGYDPSAGEAPRPTTIVRVDPDGSAVVAADGLDFPNGSVITPDGRTLVVSESTAGRLTAFTIGDDGSLSDARTWAELGDGHFPDGCALDAEGCIWSADGEHSRCRRVAPGGEIVDEVRIPAGLKCYACMLGGDDGRTLLLCSCGGTDRETQLATRDGTLFTTAVDVPHAGLP